MNEDVKQETNVDEVVDSLEEESLKELSTLKEDHNENNDKVIYDAQEELRRIFIDFRRWVARSSDPTVIKENLTKLKEDAVDVLNTTRDKAIEVSDSDQFKKTLEAGKDFFQETGNLILEGFRAGKEVLMKNPVIKDMVEQADEKLDKLRENEKLQNAATKAFEASEKLNTAIFNGVKNFFEKK